MGPLGLKEKLSVTGGVRIGWANASWPFAKLSVSESTLSVKASVLGAYKFAPDEIVALEAYGTIPIIGRGIHIVHSRTDYPETIIFWCFGNPDNLLNDIQAVGFRPRGAWASRPHRRGIPVRWTAVVALVIVWNALFILDGFVPWNAPKPPGPFVLLAIGILFAGALALQRSKTVQSWVMKPGRSVAEITSVVMLVQVISGFMLIGFSLFHFLDPAR